MYIKYKNENYQNNENLREIIKQSGEVLGTYNIFINEDGAKTKTNIILDENCIEITEDMITIPFDEKRLMLFDISQNKIIAKTDNQLKLEKLNKLQSEILSKLKDINIAISCQEATNNLLLEEEKIYTISKEDIKTIGKYQNTVATFHMSFNPDDYTLEEINETIFNQELELPEIITRLL